MEEQKNFEEEINFKNVLKNPIRLFGYSYFLIIIVIVAGGIYYVNNLGNIELNQTPATQMDSSLFKPQKIAMQKGRQIEGIDLVKVYSPEQSLINKGEELYDANCASCHGDEGRGDGPAGAALNPSPRNFHENENWVNGKEFIDLYKTLEEGIVENGMASYEYLPTEDKVAIIHYVRTFGEYPEITQKKAEETNQEYNLTESREMPATIPVNMAIDKLVEEKQSKFVDEVEKLKAVVLGSETRGAQILKSSSNDIGRIIFMLSESNEWKSNYGEFLKSIYYTAPQNGFSSKVFELNKEETVELHQYLNGLFSGKIS